MSFDPETGDKSFVAPGVLDWARRILDEGDALTGYPLAHESVFAYGLMQGIFVEDAERVRTELQW